jgi:DNA polymerase
MAAKKGPSPSLAYVPPNARYDDLVRAAKGCRACDLYARGTQTVFGEGPVPAPLVLVGEQPGDQEDKQGHPFVGPAGRVLDAALERASIPRDQVYVTNAVKHFKWEPRGKRRIHSKPSALEVYACSGWLEAELAIVKPDVVVCLGATAAQAFFGRAFRITKSRGELLDGSAWGVKSIMATYHPSALLRAMNEDMEAYERAKAELESDLAKAGAAIGFGAPRSRPPRSPRARTPA